MCEPLYLTWLLKRERSRLLGFEGVSSTIKRKTSVPRIPYRNDRTNPPLLVSVQPVVVHGA